MATRTSIAKAATATAALTEIEVLEVANVDAPSNKRPFAVVKSSDGEASPVVSPASPDSAAPAAPVTEIVTELVTLEQQAADVATSAALTGTPPATPAVEPVAVEKRGAKMAKDRLTRLATSVSELQKIIKELQDEVDVEGEPADKSKVEKAEDPNPLAPKVEELTKSVSDMQGKIDAQAKQLSDQSVAIAKQAEIIKAAKHSPAPNSSAPEGISKVAKPFRWPTDMNEQRRT